MRKFSSTMKGSSRRISQSKKNKKILFATIFFIGLLALSPQFMREISALVVRPIAQIRSWIMYSSDSFPQYFRDRSTLVKEIQDLRTQLAVSGKTHMVEALEKENTTLRSLLHNSRDERILAGVIGVPGVMPYDSFLLDKGSDEGIVSGAPVYIADNTVIGNIASVTRHTALVALATSDGFQSTVYVSGPDIFTNAVGIGGGQMRIGVPQGVPLHEGDIVFFPSVESGIYGAVSVVESESSQPEIYGYVSLDVPLSSIRFVTVGTHQMQNISFEEAQDILHKNISSAFTVPVPDELLTQTEHATTSSSTVENATTSNQSTEEISNPI